MRRRSESGGSSRERNAGSTASRDCSAITSACSEGLAAAKSRSNRADSTGSITARTSSSASCSTSSRSTFSAESATSPTARRSRADSCGKADAGSPWAPERASCRLSGRGSLLERSDERSLLSWFQSVMQLPILRSHTTRELTYRFLRARELTSRTPWKWPQQRVYPTRPSRLPPRR